MSRSYKKVGTVNVKRSCKKGNNLQQKIKKKMEIILKFQMEKGYKN